MVTSRNDPCPCGSGKKYKKCCQASDDAKGPTRMAAPASDRGLLDRLKGGCGSNCGHDHSRAHEPETMDEPSAPPTP